MASLHSRAERRKWERDPSSTPLTMVLTLIDDYADSAS